ncbi:hypothetical protein DESC_240059 [Desulfosarcina cetonica]|nr:hypothetical protein DESC_240059 [Desulfosarcina cetonica]
MVDAFFIGCANLPHFCPTFETIFPPAFLTNAISLWDSPSPKKVHCDLNICRKVTHWNGRVAFCNDILCFCIAISYIHLFLKGKVLKIKKGGL